MNADRNSKPRANGLQAAIKAVEQAERDKALASILGTEAAKILTKREG